MCACPPMRRRSCPGEGLKELRMDRMRRHRVGGSDLGSMGSGASTGLGATRGLLLSRLLVCGWLTWTMLGSPHARAIESMPPGAYEVTIEMGMPHLEENLRYATTREKRCLTGQKLSSLFPALRHESLRGCRLEGEQRHDDSVSYVLVCEAGQETTGSARWQFGTGQVTGTLDIRMGGKNMTFHERITAKPLGACAPDAR